MPKVLVTGANGLLATNVINELLSKGYKVRGLLRDKNKFTLNHHHNLELAEGDITDINTLHRNIESIDYVVHIAALTSHSLPNYDPYKRVNVDATENLLKAGISQKIKKLVYVSSANAFGYGSIESPGNETLPIKAPFSQSLYAQSKLEGQKRILQYSNQMEVTCVNPTFMIGPHDGKPSSGKIILMGYNKKVIFCPPGGKNFVNAKDAAKGVIAALEKGKNGEAYLLAGENLTYRQFFEKLSKVTNNHPKYIILPAFLLYIAGYFGNCLQFAGIKTQLTLTNMKMLCVNNFYSNNKAKKELGVEFKRIETGIEEAVTWFNLNYTGILK